MIDEELVTVWYVARMMKPSTLLNTFKKSPRVTGEPSTDRKVFSSILISYSFNVSGWGAGFRTTKYLFP